MGDKTGISWTDATWNPVRGCSRVSEGCRNCYAERVAARFSGPGQPYEGLATLKRRVNVGERDHRKHVKTVDGRKIDDGLVTDARWTGEVRLFPDKLADPLKWKRPRRIFVNSMSDLFHEKLTNEEIAAVFGVMAAAPQHTFQVLTKRAKRMREWFEWVEREAGVSALMQAATQQLFRGIDVDNRRLFEWWRDHNFKMTWPLPNVWLGVSVENQEAADERIPELLRTPAAMRFLSCEPLIGPVDLSPWLGDVDVRQDQEGGGVRLRGSDPRRDSIGWLICGCESGPRARPCSVEWIRSLRDQCKESDVALFLKQATQPGSEAVGGPLVTPGEGSKRKAGGVIELPYLDGVQHAAFPETT